MNAVMIPLINVERTDAYFELMYQAKMTLDNRKKYLQKKNKNKKINMKPHIYNLSCDRYSIEKLLESNKIDTLYIVAHHEIIGELDQGITPEQLADQFIKYNLDNVCNIHFYTCNGALDGINSYCGIFANRLWNKYNIKHLVIGGFIGYLHEDTKNKHTYLSPIYNNYQKKERCEDKIILFTY
jgi:hypothetical protein